MNNKNTIIGRAFVDALVTVVYIAFVATLIQSAQVFFGNVPDNKILAPIIVLLLFVISATITGSLVLGKPTLMYLDGQKKEAVELFFWTVGFLCLFFVLAGVILVLVG